MPERRPQLQRPVELLQGQNLGQLAREIGVSRVHLDKVRNGTRGFSDSMAKKVLDHFGWIGGFPN